MQIIRKVVFQLDLDQEERLILALENIRNLYKEGPFCIAHLSERSLY